MPPSKKKKKEDLEFQMVFFAGVLRKRPNFVDALMALGEIYTKKGFYRKGLRIDRKLAKLAPHNPIVHYNLACSFSLIGDIMSSFEAIKRAVDLGYDDFIHMDRDPDLSNLRRDERFLAFVKSVRKDVSNSRDARESSRQES